MFIISTIHDTIRVKAAQLGADTILALTYNINAKYANRVLPNVGLCVAHFDFVSVSEGHIKHGDGCTYYKVTFRLVVFRPFKGEVLLGQIKSSDENGIRITMGFFDDIHVTWHALPAPSAYDQGENTWFWVSQPTDEISEDPLLSNKDDRFWLDRHEFVRFSIEDDEFNEPEPPRPRGAGANAARIAGTAPGAGGVAGNGANAFGDGTGTAAESTDIDSAHRVPLYKIHASMAALGLGPLSWWASYSDTAEGEYDEAILEE